MLTLFLHASYGFPVNRWVLLKAVETHYLQSEAASLLLFGAVASLLSTENLKFR